MIFGNSEYYEVAEDSSACFFFPYDIMYQYYLFCFSLFWFAKLCFTSVTIRCLSISLRPLPDGSYVGVPMFSKLTEPD
jgi:hypothetical protein